MPQTNGPLDELYMCSFKTDIGWMRPISDGNSVIRMDWNQTGWHEPDRPDYVSRETKTQLLAFFKRQLHRFTVPLAPIGKNPSGRHWLDIMASIPYGTVVTYSEFATLAGKPNAARAAGTVCANNPIPIIYPCHRVIGAKRSLGNYGGGSDNYAAHRENLLYKATLLKLEFNQTVTTVRNQLIWY